MFHRRHALAAVLAVTLGLAACGGDDSGNSSSGESTPQPPPSVTPPPTPTNRAPTISGTPSSTVKTSAAYYFQPSASDADGDALTFSVAGKPSWAQFNSSTGALYGRAGDGTSGAYSGIQISVSDGKAQATLPAFTITVSDGKAQATLPVFTITVSPPVIGSATLSWQAPAKNEDGSPLTDLAGYVVRYSKNPGNLDQTISIGNPSATTTVIENLVEGTWFFTLSSVNSSGVESRPTGTVSKVIG